MKNFKKGVLGGKGFKNTVEISKEQTSRTRRQIEENLKVRDTPGSGNGLLHKGDKDIGGVFLCEEKATTGRSHRITLSTVQKICQEAMEAGAKIPALVYSFVGRDLQPHVYGDWIMLPLKHAPFLRILEQVRDV